jgi:hypothetical protein
VTVFGRAWDAWTRWWHAPPDRRVVAALRIALGVLLLVSFASQAEFVELWWGERGLVPRRFARAILDPGEGSLLFLLPRESRWLWACWALAVVQSALLALGWQARFQAACLYVWLVSFQNRNTAILDGEDGMFRLLTFFLIFLPLSDLWSVDAWLRRRRGKGLPASGSGFALRLIQIQTVFVYLVAGLEKTQGAAWLDGTAMNLVLHLDDVHGRLPEWHALADSVLASRLMTWGTLVLEAAIPVAIWFPRTRRPAMIAAIAFHLALEWMMNLFLFEWVMIAGWLTFVDWDADRAWLRRVLRRPAVAEPGSEQAAA